MAIGKAGGPDFEAFGFEVLDSDDSESEDLEWNDAGLTEMGGGAADSIVDRQGDRGSGGVSPSGAAGGAGGKALSKLDNAGAAGTINGRLHAGQGVCWPDIAASISATAPHQGQPN